MRPAAYPAFAVLAILTALVLWSSAAALRSPSDLPVPVETTSTANRTLAYRFYEAANTLIASGDASSLTDLVAAEFVDVSLAADDEPDRATMIDRLLLLHQIQPDTRLAPDVVAAVDDLVIAQLGQIDATTTPLSTGPSGSDWLPWGPVDVFRIADGRIVERRGPALDPIVAIPELQVAVTLELRSPHFQHVTITQVTIEPDATYMAPSFDGTRLIAAESGTVSVHLTPDQSSSNDTATLHLLESGEYLPLGTRSDYAATNHGSTLAVLIEVSIIAAPFTEAPPDTLGRPQASGVVVDYVADQLLIDIPTRPALLTIDKWLLGADDRYVWSDLGGPTVLHIDVGEIELTAIGDVPWTSTTANKRSDTGFEAMLTSGHGALVSSGTTAEIRTGKTPATILLVALHPVDEGP